MNRNAISKSVGFVAAVVVVGLCALSASAAVTVIDDFSSDWTSTTSTPGGPFTQARVVASLPNDAVATFTTADAGNPDQLRFSYTATSTNTQQETLLRGGYSFAGTGVGDYVQIRAKLSSGTVLDTQGTIGGLVLSTGASLSPADRTGLYRVSLESRRRIYVEAGTGPGSATLTTATNPDLAAIDIDRWVTLRLIRTSSTTIRAAYSLDADGEGDIDEPFIYAGGPMEVSDFVGVGIIVGNMLGNPGTMNFDDLVITQGESPAIALTMNPAGYTFTAPGSKEVSLGITGPAAGPGGVAMTLTYNAAVITVATTGDVVVPTGSTVTVPAGLTQVGVNVAFIGTSGQTATLAASSPGYLPVEGVFQGQFPPLTMAPDSYLFTPGNLGPQDITITLPPGATGPASITLNYNAVAISVSAADNTPIPSGGTATVAAGQDHVVVQVTFVGQVGQSSALTAALAPFVSAKGLFRQPPLSSPFVIDDFSSDWTSATGSPGGPYTQARPLTSNPNNAASTYTTVNPLFPDQLQFSFTGSSTNTQQESLLRGGYSFAGTVVGDYVQIKAKFSTGTVMGSAGVIGGLVLSTGTSLSPADRTALYRVEMESRRRIYVEPGTASAFVSVPALEANRWVALRLTRNTLTTVQASYSIDANDNGVVDITEPFTNAGNAMSVSDFVGVGVFQGQLSASNPGTMVYDDLIMTNGEQPKLPLTMDPAGYVFTAPGAVDVTVGLSGQMAGPGGLPLTLTYDAAVISVATQSNTPIPSGGTVLVPEGQSQVVVKVTLVGASGTQSALAASNSGYSPALGIFQAQFPALSISPESYLFTFPGNLGAQSVSIGLPTGLAGPGGLPVTISYNPAIIAVTTTGGTTIPSGSNVSIPEGAASVNVNVSFVGQAGQASTLIGANPAYSSARGSFQAFAEPYAILIDDFSTDWVSQLAAPGGPYTQARALTSDPNDAVATFSTVQPGFADELHYSFTATSVNVQQETLLRGDYSFAGTRVGDYLQLSAKFTPNTLMDTTGVVGGLVVSKAPTLSPTDRTQLYRITIETRRRIYVEPGTGAGGAILTTATNPDLIAMQPGRWIRLRLTRNSPTTIQASYSIDTDDEGDFDEPFVDAGGSMDVDDFVGLGILGGNMFGTNPGGVVFDNLLFVKHCADPFADFDRDGDVDQNDFASWQTCFTGSVAAEPLSNACKCFDRNEDGAVEGLDLQAFVNCAQNSGPEILVDPACDDGE